MSKEIVIRSAVPEELVEPLKNEVKSRLKQQPNLAHEKFDAKIAGYNVAATIVSSTSGVDVNVSRCKKDADSFTKKDSGKQKSVRMKSAKKPEAKKTAPKKLESKKAAKKTK